MRFVIDESKPIGSEARTVPCECKRAEIERKRLARLEKRDGLNEEQRGFLLSAATRSPEQAKAAAGVQAMLDAGYGQALLHGAYGSGKTYVLIAAVNAAKAAGVAAHYTTMSDLLKYFRQAFAPDATETEDQKWELLTTVPVLAVDELNHIHTTPWALQQLRELVDKRWVNLRTRVTLYSMNATAQDVARAGLGDMADRLEDSRAEQYWFRGPSQRQMP